MPRADPQAKNVSWCHMAIEENEKIFWGVTESERSGYQYILLPTFREQC